MALTNIPYPANPSNVPVSVTQVSEAFKKEVSRVMGSIFLFFIVYLILFALSIALVIGCAYLGVMIIITVPKFITIAAGAGLILFAVMIFVFLVKFLFAVSRFDHSKSIEVTEADQPVLFAFIRQLSKDTHVPFPKKIYISPEVNACVFYNSSFWSMILPVRKNLQIGLGLVNAINVSEFKSVIAHEFGHFSQRSMKLGSFVYNVNKVIYNMLYENTSYSNFLGQWASVGSVFALFASLTAKFAQGIQSIQQKMYGIVNKNYMRLSREMEFHADAVAASVSGSNSMITVLRRLELADAGYNTAINVCNDLFVQKKVSCNIYQNQTSVLKHYVEEFKLPVNAGLPVVTREFMLSNNLSRINFKDQWASHPSTDEREKHLLSLSVAAEINDQPAWVLFNNPEQLQKALTNKLYEHLPEAKTMTLIEDSDFEIKYKGDISSFSLPSAYNGFYDGRQITLIDMDKMENSNQDSLVFDVIFSQSNSQLYKKIKATEGDIETLKAIAEKKIATTSFDFDGEKYDKKEAIRIVEKLEQEKKSLQEELCKADEMAISFFIHKAKLAGFGEELKKAYKDYFLLRSEADVFLSEMNEMFDSLAPIYRGETIGIESINSMIGGLKNQYEIRLKRHLRFWLEKGAFTNSQDDEALIKKFIDSHYEYFSGTSFFENELQELNTVCNKSWALVSQFLFQQFKIILDKQLTY